MNDKDNYAWHDNFNPLQLAMHLLEQAQQSKTGRATREFLFDTAPTEAALYNYQVVWYYFSKMVDTTDCRRTMFLIRKDNIHLFAICDINGISQDIFDKYTKVDCNG